MAVSPLSLGAQLFTRLRQTISGTPETAVSVPDAARVNTSMAALNEYFNMRADALANGLTQRRISLEQWQSAMQGEIRRHHLTAGVIARGGVANMDAGDRAIIEQQTARQIGYLNNWTRELARTDITPEQAKRIAARARLYAGAANETVSRIQAKALIGVEMPFYPADRTLCHTNCKCFWVFQATADGFKCYYRIAIAEHCSVCIARAKVANPLIVSAGVIVDAEKYQAPELYA